MSSVNNIHPDAMLNYIKETPEILVNIIKNRKEITAEFIKNYHPSTLSQIYIIGSGTSFHGGYAVAGVLEKILKIPVTASYPIPFKDTKKCFDQRTLVIGISQGGESLSTIAGIEHAKSYGLPTLCLTESSSGSVLGSHCETTISLHCGTELAGPKTKGYHSTMMILLILGLETALHKGTLSPNEYDQHIDRLFETVKNLSKIITLSHQWYLANQSEFKMARRIVIVGYEGNYGNVLEGRLKIQEAVRYGIEGYELEEFMHGIYHSIDDEVYVIYLTGPGQYKERILRLKEFMSDYTTHQFAIGHIPGDNLHDLVTDFVDDADYSIFEYIIPLQSLAFYLSKDLGINANIPKIINFHYLMGSK